MTEMFLALIPTYGVWMILTSVALSGLALPVPSSVIVMVAGGFSAAGEIALWQLILFAYAGFMLGDQITFWLSRRAGGPLLDRIAARPRSAAIVTRAKQLVENRGLVAVFLSRTVLSPLGPYVGCISGALGMAWTRFTGVAAIGALIWSVSYAVLGYTLADQITQVIDGITSSVGVIATGVIALGILIVLRSDDRGHKQKVQRCAML